MMWIEGRIRKHTIPIDGQLWFPGWWIPIRLAPVGPHLEGITKEGDVIDDMHFAQDLSGEEQPPFSGWFRPMRSGRGFFEIFPSPVAWRKKENENG
ncbi:MAG: hypothetical protein GF411_14680 [Candidatus Lokiarchaeota archaeon]|nr:hypothetical protein [Candidatus Lokiarchaeota archaeon]